MQGVAAIDAHQIRNILQEQRGRSPRTSHANNLCEEAAARIAEALLLSKAAVGLAREAACEQIMDGNFRIRHIGNVAGHLPSKVGNIRRSRCRVDLGGKAAAAAQSVERQAEAADASK